MSLKRFSWQFVLGLFGAGMMSMTAYGQNCNSCSDGATYAPAPSHTAAGCNSCGTSACGGRCGGASIGSRLSGLTGSVTDRLDSLGGCNSGRCEGDARTLFGSNCDEPWVNIGGWLQAGVHTDSNGLFNSLPSDFNVHQAWLYAERVAESKNGNLGFGFRFDGMYGIDANDTQAFGNPGATWDLDPRFTRNGGFGWALPQLYGEIAKGDLSVKVGHFYTLVGYEVVTAPDNFFYSHAMTMYNSEPFTHTGAVATYNVNDDTTVYGGWTAGWDSGFDFSAGSNFIGGFSKQIDPDINLTYIHNVW